MSKAVRPRVLFLTTWYPTRDRPTHGTFIREHARAAALYADVCVLHVYPLRRRGLRPVLEMESDTNLTLGLPTYRVGFPRPAPKTAYLSYLRSVLWAYRRIVADGFPPDLIHANVYEAGVPGVLLGNRHHLPVVISEHYTAFPLKRLSRLEIAKARWSFEHSDCVLPVSAYLQRSIESYAIKARFEVVPNTVDGEVFHPPDSAREASGRSARLLFVGMLDELDRKGLGVLLEALAEIRKTRDDWSLTVVGDGPGRPSRERQAVLSGIADRVDFVGVLPRLATGDAMRESTLFVLPSRMETFGCAVVEALACGLPVIVGAAGALPEIVTEEVGWLVPPDDTQALAAALSDALSTPRAATAETLHLRAGRFAPAVIGRQLLRVYGGLLGADRRPTHSGVVSTGSL